MYSNTILKLDLIIIIIQKYCFKYLKPDKDISKKSKTIQFVLDQLNDIRKTKDFKTLKSIFTIEKNYKIKDLKDWLGILCVNKPGLFSKHFKLDVEIDMTRGYRTYVNLLTKLGNNKTKVDLKESNKKISILFNLLFCNIIVGGVGSKKKHTQDKSLEAFFRSLKEKEKDKKQLKKIRKIEQEYNKSILTGKARLKAFIFNKLILPNIKKKYGTEIARETKLFTYLITILFPNSENDWLKLIAYIQSLHDDVLRPYNEIYPIVQQSHLGSCWINSILVALMYPYYLKEELKTIIIFLLKESKKEETEQKSAGQIRLATFARKIQQGLRQLLILQYSHNRGMTDKECILPDLSFVSAFITQLTINRDIFKTFSQVKNHPDKDLNDIILNEGGTTEDIFKLIKILLENGLNFEKTEDSDKQDYTKNINGKKITIRVTIKPVNNAVDETYLTEGFEFASIILYNDLSSGSPGSFGGFSGSSGSFGSSGDMDVSGSSGLADMIEDSMEEEKPAGHVITIVTDNNRKLFFYNGWIYDNIVNPLRSTDGRDISLKTKDEKELVFDLLRSKGIMILFKVEPVS